MKPISTEELQAFAADIDLTVDDAELDAVRERVNERLAGVEPVVDLDIPQAVDLDGRTWQTADDDPYNAIAVECDVPPTDAHGDGLADTTVGVKDVIAIGGVPMECASPVMTGFVPRRDATVVQRLRAAGATIALKTNLDEFAASARGLPARGAIRNPHDEDRTAGGSSGGSAVAVATGRVDVALGTDTGGSIRIPSAFCGIVGLKPTHGLVSLDGVVENTYTQDHVGPMAPTVADAARVLDAIAGADDRDPASLQAAGREGYRTGAYTDAATAPSSVEALSVAVLEDGFGEGVDDEVEARTNQVVDQLAEAGATVSRVSVDGFEHAGAIKSTLSVTELAAYWRDAATPVRRGGVVDEGFQAAFASRSAANSGTLGESYKSKLVAGAVLLDRYQGQPYTRAQAAREALREAVVDALDGVDALLFPSMPSVAPPIEAVDDPGFGYGRNVRLANVTRQPAITLPNGTVDGLPVGLQLVADEFEEATLVKVAAAVEGVIADG